ncbi:hypothetical protein D3C71_472620 [compost metagenome]
MGAGTGGLDLAEENFGATDAGMFGGLVNVDKAGHDASLLGISGNQWWRTRPMP